MKVLHKKNQGKSIRNEGVYSCVLGHDEVRKMRFSGELQNDSGRLLDEERVLLG